MVSTRCSSHSSKPSSHHKSTSSGSARSHPSQQHSPISRRRRALPPRTVAEARAAFTARLAPSYFGRPQASAAAMEDGEIRERAAATVDEAAEREQCIFAGINLALLEALGQNGAAALAACNQSLIASAGALFCPSLKCRHSSLSSKVDA